MRHPDLFEPPEQRAAVIEPWRPRPLTREEWPPPYERVYAWRIETLNKIRSDPAMLADMDEYYRTRPVQWINDHSSV